MGNQQRGGGSSDPPKILDPKDPRLNKVIHVRSNGRLSGPPPPILDKERPWCRVYYSELTQRVGSPFEAYKSTVTIDGTMPGFQTQSRMALASFPTARDPRCGLVRIQIGEGISLTYNGETIVLTVLSDQPTFVLCPFVNYFMGDSPTTVLRVQNLKEENSEGKKSKPAEKKTLTLFNKKQFDEELKKHYENPTEDGFDFIRSLGSCKISFIKGFGDGYTRQFVSNCSCWVDIAFSDPLEAYDKFARQNADILEGTDSQ